MMSSTEHLSRAKTKRLNKKAKVARLEAELCQEKSFKTSAERAAKHWREKALMYRRKVVEEESKKLVTMSNLAMYSPRVRFPCSSRQPSHSLTLPKATPSVPKTCFNPHTVPSIDERLLQTVDHHHDSIGVGCFGSCVQLIYKDIFTVCVKRVKKDIALANVKSEAAILFKLNSCEYTPHCFGVCIPQHAIVMSFIHVSNKPVTLWSLLYDKKCHISLSRQQYISLLLGLCNGLKCIHSKGFLHNDLKLDNVSIGSTLSGQHKAYIIDFGKACPVGKGKIYSLHDAEQKRYKSEHPQVAPDLRDGLVEQSVATDVYSLGRILKRCNSVILHSADLSDTVKRVLCYHSKDRIDIEKILITLNSDL